MTDRITSEPSTAHTRLPSYEELQAERDLKETFAHLEKDHEDLQGLFKKVSVELETSPQIGEEHELTREWEQLSKRHKKLYKDSQLNASQCASFLNNYQTVLVPLSKGKMSVKEKKFMINKFIEVIPVHQESARRTSERFHELGKQVEVFPTKVASYLRQQADQQGFWSHFWVGVQEMFMSLWEALHQLFDILIRTFKAMLSHISTIRFSCFAFVKVDIELAECHPEPRLNGAIPLKDLKRDCKDIAERLSGFEDAWHMVRLACSNLLEDIDMAGALSAVPSASDAYLRTAETIYHPLIHCLRAYATGKSPL